MNFTKELSDSLKSQDISFKDGVLYEKESNVGDSTKASFVKDGKAISCFERGNSSLEWELDHSNCQCGCGGVLKPISVNGDLSCEKECNCGNIAIRVEAEDFQLKEIIVVKSEPLSNRLKFNISKTNLSSFQVCMEGDNFSYKVFWRDETGKDVFVWKPIEINDLHGNKTFGVYLLEDGNGDIEIEIPQDYLDLAFAIPDNQIEIDPTTAVIAAGLKPNPSFDMHPFWWQSYNGTTYISVMITGSNTMKVFRSTSPTGPFTDETPPYIATTDVGWSIVGVNVEVVSNGDFHITKYNFKSPDQDLFITKRTAAGAFDGSWTTVDLLISKNAHDTSVDENNNIWVLAMGVSDLRLTKVATAGGSYVITLEEVAGGVGTLGDNISGATNGKHVFGLSAEGSDKLHIYFKSDAASTDWVYYQTYIISTQTFSSAEQTSADANYKTSTGAPFDKGSIHMDGNAKPHLFYKKDGGNVLLYFDRISGSWTFKNQMGQNPSPRTMNDQNNVMVMDVNSNTLLTWNGSGFDSTTPFGAGVSGVGTQKSYLVQTLRKGQPVHFMLEDATDTLFGEDDNFDFPVGDLLPPTVSDRDPAANATEVAEDTNINFRINDAISGVDKDTIQTIVDEINAIIDGVIQAGFGGSIISINSTNYSVSINPDADFILNQTVVVEIDVDDNVGNIMPTVVYSFAIRGPDQEAPYGGIISLPVNRSKTSNIFTLQTTGWKDVGDRSLPLWYQFQVSTDPDFLKEVTTYKFQLSNELEVTLEPNARYYARVRSADSAEI